jgi:hypothetical protein
MSEQVKTKRSIITMFVLSSFLLVFLIGTGMNTAWAAKASVQHKKSVHHKKSVRHKKRAGKRKVARTREDMILESEMKAIKEALATKTDQENTEKFASKAEKELQKATDSANEARSMLEKANTGMTEVSSAKEAALAAIQRAQAAADEARAMADKAKQDAKMASLEASTYVQLRADAKKEVERAASREDAAQKVLSGAQAKEAYYRNLVKRRMRNAEDFYYIAAAAMKKGGNAQALEFAVKAKAEMEQAKIAENEAAIRAEATKAAEKVVEARREATAAAKIKSSSLAKLLTISKGIASGLEEAYKAAKLSSAAALKVLSETKDFASAKDDILAYANKKVESLTDIKTAAEQRETLASAAAESARAVVAAKAKAQAEAQARANAALLSAKTAVIGDAATEPASTDQGTTEAPESSGAPSQTSAAKSALTQPASIKPIPGAMPVAH